jgi:predicted nicotinamide N-methyase
MTQVPGDSEPVPRGFLEWVRRPSEPPTVATEGTPDGDLTGTYAWPSGSRLASELGKLVECADRCIVDLGCGLGQLGFSALALGARHVLFADGSPVVVDRIARTIALNGLDGRANVICHQWGEPLPGRPYPLILGGDILYRPECAMALIETIAASLAPGGSCLLSDPRRRWEDELVVAARACSLQWAFERRDAGYSLARLTRA